MKSRYIFFLLTIVSIIFARVGLSPRSDRLPIADYPNTDQPIESVVKNPSDVYSLDTMYFSTSDSPETVRKFYEQSLQDDGWDVELIPIAAIQPLPTPSTSNSLLVHGGDIRGCPLNYVDVVIEPHEKSGSYVNITVGSVPCY
jgi:hypothetical protein